MQRNSRLPIGEAMGEGEFEMAGEVMPIKSRSRHQFMSHYCEWLVDHMASGLTFESFGRVIGVGVRTLKIWLEEYPDFEEALDKGVSAAHYFTDAAVLAHIQGRGNMMSATMLQFRAKNLHPNYNAGDRLEHAGEVKGGAPPVTIVLSKEDNAL